MHIGELQAPPKKKKKRVGRGPGSGNGKTAGRGHNGQRSRSGFKSRAWFEGGQMPLQRRVPKRGFKSLKPNNIQIVNVLALKKYEDGQTVDPAALKAEGFIKHVDRPVKILGSGDLDRKLIVYANAFSQSAKAKIEQAGGEVHIVIQSKKNDSIDTETTEPAAN